MAKRAILVYQVFPEMVVKKDRWEIKVKLVRKVKKVYQVNNNIKIIISTIFILKLTIYKGAQSVGSLGDIGMPGFMGLKGSQGDAGEPGYLGKEGIRGLQGDNGLLGRPGLFGEKGNDGLHGLPVRY